MVCFILSPQNHNPKADQHQRYEDVPALLDFSPDQRQAGQAVSEQAPDPGHDHKHRRADGKLRRGILAKLRDIDADVVGPVGDGEKEGGRDGDGRG